MRGAAQPRGAEATIGDCGSVRRMRSHKEKMSESTPTARPLRVFIADDSPAVSEMLVALIYDRGRIEVVGTGDSEAGSIESIQRLRPDVVVLDLQLKGGSGTNVIRALRADPSFASTRLFVASNHVSEPMRAGCLGLGADGYYDKVKELGRLATALAELSRSARTTAS